MKLTREMLARSAKIERYRREFERFCREQLWVKPKEPGPLRKFILNPAQIEIERIAQEQIRDDGWLRLAILKARQQGISTYSSARGVWRTALNDNIFNLVVAHDKDTAKTIFDLTKLFYDQLDEDAKPVIRFSNRAELSFENPDDRTRGRFPGRRSKITFTTANNYRAGTGQTIHALHLSECAKYMDAATVTQSLFPAVPEAPGTSVIMESTGWPTGDWFKDFCDQAKRGRNGYRFVFLPWFISPEYRIPLKEGQELKLGHKERQLQERHSLTAEQLNFRRRKIEGWGGDQEGEDRFDIEFPSESEDAWRTLEMSTFDHRRLAEMKKELSAPYRKCEIHPGPAILDDLKGRLSIWEMPAPGKLYDIGVDVGGGNEDGDFSVAQVLTREKPHRQVARWRGHMNPIDFGQVCFWLGMFYNTAQLAIECDGIGFATNSEVQRMGYPFVYIWRQREKAVPKLTGWSGWRTTQESKRFMVAVGKHQLMHSDFVIRCPITHHEFANYSTIPLPGGGEAWRGGPGCHDDEVTSFLIAIVVSEDETFGVMDAAPPPERPKLVDPSLVDLEGISGMIRVEDELERMARELKGVD